MVEAIREASLEGRPGLIMVGATAKLLPGLPAVIGLAVSAAGAFVNVSMFENGNGWKIAGPVDKMICRGTTDGTLSDVEARFVVRSAAVLLSHGPSLTGQYLQGSLFAVVLTLRFESLCSLRKAQTGVEENKRGLFPHGMIMEDGQADQSVRPGNLADEEQRPMI